MVIDHNHKDFRLDGENCPACRLVVYAEELLEAAEKALKGEIGWSTDLKAVVDKIRGDK